MNTSPRPGRIGKVVWLLSATAMVLLAACAGTSNPPHSTPSQEEVADPINMDWSRLQGMTPIEAGRWTLSDCDPGEAPLLCVSVGEEVQGMLEAVLLTNDPPVTSIEDFAADYARDNREDRERGCPAGYRVTVEDPRFMNVAGGQGLRTDFSVADAEGRLVERTVSYFLFEDARRVVIVAHALSPSGGGCLERLGGEFDPEELGHLIPLLDRLAAGSSFPGPAWIP